MTSATSGQRARTITCFFPQSVFWHSKMSQQRTTWKHGQPIIPIDKREVFLTLSSYILHIVWNIEDNVWIKCGEGELDLLLILLFPVACVDMLVMINECALLSLNVLLFKCSLNSNFFFIYSCWKTLLINLAFLNFCLISWLIPFDNLQFLKLNQFVEG